MQKAKAGDSDPARDGCEKRITGMISEFVRENIFLFFKIFVCLFERACGWRRRCGGAGAGRGADGERTTQADALLSVEPDSGGSSQDPEIVT